MIVHEAQVWWEIYHNKKKHNQELFWHVCKTINVYVVSCTRLKNFSSKFLSDNSAVSRHHIIGTSCCWTIWCTKAVRQRQVIVKSRGRFPDVGHQEKQSKISNKHWRMCFFICFMAKWFEALTLILGVVGLYQDNYPRDNDHPDTLGVRIRNSL